GGGRRSDVWNHLAHLADHRNLTPPQRRPPDLQADPVLPHLFRQYSVAHSPKAFSLPKNREQQADQIEAENQKQIESWLAMVTLLPILRKAPARGMRRFKQEP